MNAVTDLNMADFIAAKSDRLNNEDLVAGPITIKVTGASRNGGDDGPINLHYDGDNGRPFRPCLTMRRLIMRVWGPRVADYIGRSMTLYRDPTVTFGPDALGGVRVSHMSHLDEKQTFSLQAAKGRFKKYTVQPLAADDPAQTWTDKFIAKIDTFDNRDDLTAFEAGQEKRLTDLKAKRPELHASIGLAIANKLESFGTGPSDTQRGEPQTLADVQAAIAKAATTADVDAIMRTAKEELSDEDMDAAMGLASDRIAEL
jgi:hypothetical protein